MLNPGEVFGLYLLLGAIVIAKDIRDMYLTFFGGDDVSEEIKADRDYFEKHLDLGLMRLLEQFAWPVFGLMVVILWMNWLPHKVWDFIRFLKKKKWKFFRRATKLWLKKFIR